MNRWNTVLYVLSVSTTARLVNMDMQFNSTGYWLLLIIATATTIMFAASMEDKK